jgi:YegS/Rv2252/BmrU family lipid kinase
LTNFACIFFTKPELLRKILFILNPAAGIKRLSDLDGFIRENLDLTRFEYEIKVTSRQGDALLITKQAVGSGCSVIVAVGGDGTINEIAKGIEGTDVLLGIVPNGSGNGLARHLGIPLDLGEAIRTINGFHHQRIDTATLNGNTFVSIAGVGFDARVANRYRKVRRRGFYGYFRIVVLQYFSYKERPYILEVDGKTMERTALFISVANSNQFGYGTIIAPAAKLDDGLLDVVIARKFPLTELPYILQLLFTQRIDKSSYVETLKGREINIARKKGRYVNLDGEAVKTDSFVSIRVKPSSLKVLLPDKSFVKKTLSSSL